MPLWLPHLFARFGYGVVALGVFLENLGVPVPGETILLAAGFFARRGNLRVVDVMIIGAAAAIFGDNFGYLIGRRGGRAFVLRFGRYVGLTPERLASVDRFFARNGTAAVFFARFISGVRVFAAVFCGISRFPWQRFVIVNAAGGIVWAVTITMLGYAFGSSWQLLEHRVGAAGILLVILVALIFMIALVLRHRDRVTLRIREWLPSTVTTHELLLIGASLIAVALFAKVSEDVVEHETTIFDSTVTDFVLQVKSPVADVIMRTFNAIGGGIAIDIVIVIVLVWILRRRDHAALWSFLFLAITIQIVDAALKLGFHRARPVSVSRYTFLYSASYPSGHAMNAVAVFGMAAFLLAQQYPRFRWYGAGIAGVLALAVGTARVYLRLHWPTDILGGYAAGALVLVCAVYLYLRLADGELASRQRTAA